MKEVIYDVRDFASIVPGPEWIPAFVLTVVFAIGVWRARRNRPVAVAALVLCLFVSAMLIVRPAIWRIHNGRKLNAGIAETVEGFVYIIPDTFKTYKEETIRVGYKVFTYSPYEPSGGFQKASFANGPLHSGDYVCIDFIGTDIVRIVRRTPPTSNVMQTVP